jgi:carbonic anhydrase
MPSIQDLFSHNRAWAAEMEATRPGFFTSLVKQQTPKYMWIGCSDSRVPANVEDIMVVGHYGCSGVQAALEAARIGLADNWIRHIQDVRHRHRQLLDSLPEAARANALCDINVIEQVVNVSVSTVMVDAWARGQKVSVHGWCFGVHDGLLKDLKMTVSSSEQLDGLYRHAIDQVWDHWNKADAHPLASPAVSPGVEAALL